VEGIRAGGRHSFMGWYLTKTQVWVEMPCLPTWYLCVTRHGAGETVNEIPKFTHLEFLLGGAVV